MHKSRIVPWLVVPLLAAASLLGLPGPANAADGHPVIRVGTEGTYPPFTYLDPRTEQLTGYDIEVIKAVAEEAGWQLKFVESAVRRASSRRSTPKRIDVIANQVTINPEREARYLFTAAVHLLARRDRHRRRQRRHHHPRRPRRARRPPSRRPATGPRSPATRAPRCKSVEGFAQAAELLVQGRVDAIVNDNIAVLDYLASTGSKDIKIAGDAGDEVSEQALAFRQDDAALRDQADAALEELARRRHADEDLGELLRRRRHRARTAATVDVKGSRHRPQHRGGRQGRGLADAQGASRARSR